MNLVGIASDLIGQGLLAMLKEDSFAWQNSDPFDTSKVLQEIGLQDLASILTINNVTKLPERIDFPGHCSDLSSG